jgi:hypothetical protein
MQGPVAAREKAGELYSGNLISMPELAWGETWLWPGRHWAAMEQAGFAIIAVTNRDGRYREHRPNRHRSRNPERTS